MNLAVKLIAAAAQATAHLDNYSRGIHGVMNITPEEWEVLKTKMPWDVSSLSLAQSGLQKCFDGIQAAAGLPPQALNTPYACTIVSKIVSPVNWGSASRMFQSTPAELIMEEFDADTPLPPFNK